MQSKIKGFTLIELIAVIIILSFIIAGSAGIIVSFMRGQVLIGSQSDLSIDSQLTMDRITKELRTALPYSLNVTNGNRCVKFLPVVGTSFYIDEVPDRDNRDPAAGRTTPIDVAPYTVSGGDAVFISIGAGSSSEVYGNSSDSLVEVRSLATTSITLESNHRWRRNSPEQRFFLTDQPQAFCIQNNELRYYRDVSQRSQNVDLSGSYDVLYNTVSASGRAFDVDDGSNACQHCVTTSLLFSDGDTDLEKVTTVSLFYGN